MILNEKGILQQFDLVIYPVPLIIAIGDLEKEINRYYKPYQSQYNYIAYLEDDTGAVTYQVRDKKNNEYCLMIWFPTTDITGSYLCHECGHVTLEIFKYINAHVDYDNQEPFCYLLGSIFRLCSNAFYHWKDYMKNNKTKKKKQLK